MIEKIVELARSDGRAGQADALWREEDQLTLKFESGRLKETARRREAGTNLRVVAHGRVGTAGTTELAAPDAPDDLLRRALASAEQGEPCDLVLPAACPVPDAPTFDDRAAGMDVASLAAIGRRVVEQLTRPGWQVNASVDRTLETTRFLNSAGQAFGYRATAVHLAAEVTRVAGDDVLMVFESVTRTGVPADHELDDMARSIALRMERAARVVAPPEGKLPVLFDPRGSAALLLPLRQALSGQSVLQGVSPLGGKIGETLFDTSLDLTDEPLLDGRPGTRPADDEGVVSERLGLIERGTLRGFVYDLETAARAKTRSTGHGRRSTFGKPSIGFSNLVIRPGAAAEAELLAAVGHGLVVEELIGVGQGNVMSGAFSHPVALAYRVDGGEITGRVKDAAVAGNAYQLLRRIRLIGKDARWIGGTRLVPPLVVEGVSVAGR